MAGDSDPATTARRASKTSTPVQRIGAFGVHIFTACGAALALLAMIAAVQANWASMFVWLGVALIVDGVDGTIARRARVSEVLPRWSGDTLDYVVDFATYVFVPAYAVMTSGLLPAATAVPLGIVIVVTSALYFADRNMKTADNYFLGFPAVWNIAAFYLFVLKPPPWLGAVAIVVLAVLTFLPIKFIHPFRVARLRMLSVAMLALWAALALHAVVHNLDVGPWAAAGLSAVAVYFFGVGALRLRN